MGDIRTGQAVDYNSLATVLCQRAQGSDDAIQLICMRWLRELVAVAKPQLKEQYADILAAVLPSLSHSRPDIASVRILQLPHPQQLYRSWAEAFGRDVSNFVCWESVGLV